METAGGEVGLCDVCCGLPVASVGHCVAVPELYCPLELRILHVPKSQDTLRLFCEGYLTCQTRGLGAQESTWLSKPFMEEGTAQTLKPQLYPCLALPHLRGVKEGTVGWGSFPK